MVTRSQARLTEEKLAELKDVPGFAETFLLDGKPPAAGATLKQSALAATLEQLSHAGLDDFYRGDVGREIAADLERIGSPVTRAGSDALPRQARRAAERRRCKTGTAYNTPAPTQGVASLMILALFERFDVAEAEGFDHVHGLVESTKRALRVRDRVVTDPDYLAHPLDRLLEARFLAGEAMKIDRRKASRWPVPYGEGDTVWMGAADAVGSRRLLHPVAVLGIRLRLRAAAHRRADAEPRRELFARTRRAQSARARPAAVPHAQPGARGAQGRPHHGLRHHGRRRPAADAGPAVHAPRAVRPAARRRRSIVRAGCSAAPGDRR